MGAKVLNSANTIKGTWKSAQAMKLLGNLQEQSNEEYISIVNMMLENQGLKAFYSWY